MAEYEHAQITPSGSSQSRANGRGRGTTSRKTWVRGREVEQIGVPKQTQSMLRNGRTIQRQMEKDLREFNSLKMDPLGCLVEFLQIYVMKFEKLIESDSQITTIEGYDVLYYFLSEYQNNEFNQVRIEIGEVNNYGSTM